MFSFPTGFFEMKMKYDESDNALIRASRAVTDRVTDFLGNALSYIILIFKVVSLFIAIIQFFSGADLSACCVCSQVVFSQRQKCLRC